MTDRRQVEGAVDEGDLIHKVALARARAGLLGISTGPVKVGRYEIADRIGSGARGVVYSAHDDQLGRKVAIKLLHGDVRRSEGGGARLLREAKAMAKLSHPNVAHVYEVGYHDDTLFIAMEFVDGQTLAQWGQQPRAWQEVVDMHFRAGKGLAAAHKAGMIHRDYKPDNVLVGGDGRPRVLDFGLARPDTDVLALRGAMAALEQTLDVDRPVEITATGKLLGTPAYMAPEQLEGVEFDARADQYAFCVALFKALYAAHPFRAASLTELVDRVLARDPVDVPAESNVPKALRAVLLRGLSHDPANRYPSMDALLEQLTVARSNRAMQTAGRWAAVGALVLAMAGVGWWATTSGVTRQPTSIASAAGDALTGTRDAWQGIVARSGLPDVVFQPLEGDRTRTTVHRLENGLTVYVSPRKHETVVHVSLVVRADYRDERPGQEGLAPLVMRSVNAGTRRLGTGDFEIEAPLLEEEHRLIEAVVNEGDPRKRQALIERVGQAEEDASPLFRADVRNIMRRIGADGVTVERGSDSIFTAVLPGNRFGTLIEAWGELFQRPVFRGFLASVQWARQRVDESARAAPEVWALDRAWAPNPAARDPAAVADNLASLPLAKTREFYGAYYRPNNIALVVVGDVEPGDVLPAVRAAFGAWEPSPIPMRPAVRGREPTPTHVKASQPVLAMAWHLGGAVSDDDWPVLDALAGVLSGRHGLLSGHAARFDPDGLPPVLGPNYLAITALPGRADSSPHAAAEDIRKVLERVAKHEVTDERWAAATAQGRYLGTEWSTSPEKLALEIAHSYADGRSWRSMVRSKAPDGIPREHVEALAQRLLANAPALVRGDNDGTFVPELPALFVPTDPANAAKLSPLAQELLAHRVPVPEPQFIVAGRHYTERPYGGGTLVLVPNAGPRFEVALSYAGGAEHDPWACLALKAKVADVSVDRALAGVELYASCGVTQTGLVVRGLDAEFERVWPRVLAWLADAQVSEQAAKDTLSDLVSLRSAFATETAGLVSALILHAVTRGRTAGPAMPKDAELRAADAAVLIAALDRMATVPTDVGYIGPRPEAFAKQLPPVSAVRAAAPPPTRRADPSAQHRTQVVAVDTPGESRVSVWFVAMPPPKMSSRERLIARLLIHQPPVQAEAGVEVLHWTQEIEIPVGIRAARPDLGLFGFAGPADELPLMLDRGARTLARVPTRGELEELRGALESVLRQDRLPRRWIPTIVGHWRRQGLTADPLVEEWLTLPAVTHEEIETFAVELRATAPVIAVAADRSRIDERDLAGYGEVSWISATALVAEPGLADGTMLGYFEHAPGSF